MHRIQSASAAVLLIMTLAMHGLAAEDAGKMPPAEPADAAPIVYEAGRQVCVVDCDALHESSGVACGRINEGVFWTHNDSGDQPVVYAFNTDGELLATFRVTGATARDWEDMASVKIGRNGYLLIADVGDNNKQRKDCKLYLVPEPSLKAVRFPKGGKPAGPPKPVSTMRCEEVAFSYEDGPHNCESAAIDPQTLKVYLVSKEEGNATCKVYEVPSPKEWKRAVVAKPIAELKLPTTSGMDISPDGRRAIITTYGNAYEYTRKAGDSWKDAFARQPREIALPARAQGESICYGPDGQSLYLTSETKGGGGMPLFEVPVKNDNAEKTDVDAKEEK